MTARESTTEACRPDLILASTSRYRQALLERLGVPFRCVAPDFDESSIPPDSLPPRALAECLARGKAESVAAYHPDATVIGSDQLISIDGLILGKPGLTAVAVKQLESLAGRSHELITAMVVAQGSERRLHTDVTRLLMRPLDPAAIERYVGRDMPIDCAGSYKLEQSGITLFERIESEDHTAITGLPLIALTGILRELGFRVP